MPAIAAPAAPAANVMPRPVEPRSPGPDRIRPRRGTVVVLALIAVAFLLSVAGNLNAPFGDSYEGRNGGVWGEGSRAIREDGPIASGLGARHGTGLVYTRHPPLIYPLTATAEVIGGERPAATRAPSVLAALATIGLLYGLLRTIGLRRAASLAGVAIVSTTSMFTVYGTMPDTPMLGLPLGLLAVTAWLRRRQGRPWSRGVEWALAIAAALTAWQAVFVVLVIAAAEAARAAPVSDGPAIRRRLRAAMPFLGGTVVGLTLTVAWVIWASGGIDQLVDALSERSGSRGGVDYAGIASAQLVALVDLFGVAVLGFTATLVAVRGTRYRAVAAILLAAVFGYALVTPTGASGHDYWLYWSIAPIALGWALAVHALLDPARDGSERSKGALIAVLVGLLMVTGWASQSRAGRAIEQGTEAGRLVADVDLPDDQQVLPTVGVINHLAAWIPYATGTDTDWIADPDELRAMAESSPDHLILASTWCGSEAWCVPITGGGGSRTDHDYIFVTAADAWDRVVSS